MKSFQPRFIILVLVFWVCSASFAQASAPMNQVKTSIDRILEILTDKGLQGEEQAPQRREMLKHAIHERFDFRKMSQLSLARHWKPLAEDQRQEFVRLFSQLLETSYLAKIESYTDEKVVYIKEKVKRKKAQINTKIVTDTVEIPINYRMFTQGNGLWKVYDMVIEGVSLVSNYRSQFGQILEKDSFEDLVNQLKKKINSP